MTVMLRTYDLLSGFCPRRRCLLATKERSKPEAKGPPGMAWPERRRRNAVRYGCNDLGSPIFFRLLGCRILGRNLREGPRRIDLVAEDAGWVVVELRYRVDVGRRSRGERNGSAWVEQGLFPGLTEKRAGFRHRTRLLRS